MKQHHQFSRWMGLPIPFVFGAALVAGIVLWTLHGLGVIDLTREQENQTVTNPSITSPQSL